MYPNRYTQALKESPFGYFILIWIHGPLGEAIHLRYRGISIGYTVLGFRAKLRDLEGSPIYTHTQMKGPPHWSG